ncbi:PadR family transcriptional regulator [Streptococcus oricebi]|uniref:PadR family transcriptional regulator n=1 Tax=Streptococcus oricebi TaxID=1547447 RepID=A0ABS5B1C2_9STRE|nr:PadR family transcriptional regulator [Streptococcus oricebi]MBP2622629.1 PadR family transcriptional regulator [Streptococcus oricebi]
MNKIILGLLMFKRLTIYEIRGLIRENFSSICSDSMGSIQAALKKLEQEGLVTFEEFVQAGKNKKQYAISQAGRNTFSQWLRTPMDVTRTKNMDLSKFLFMGLVPAEERLDLLDKAIEMIEKELAALLQVKENIAIEAEQNAIQAYLKADEEYLAALHEVTGNENTAENIQQIGYFEFMTLQLGIDTMKFHLDWFRKLREKIQQGDWTMMID